MGIVRSLRVGGECRATKLFQALFHYFGHRMFYDDQMESLLPLVWKGCLCPNGNRSSEILRIFLGPLCSSRDAVGIMTSPLTGLIEEQVPLIANVKLIVCMHDTPSR